MKGIITSIGEELLSRNGGTYFYVFFKLENGQSARTHLVKSFRNFSRWKPFLDMFHADPSKEVCLSGLDVKNGIIDADSRITINHNGF